jgi:hypothetical protein
MNDLTQQQQNLENNSEDYKMNVIRTSLTLAFNRTGTEFDKELANSMYFDIADAFPNLTLDEFTKALKNGGLGVYGKTYKLTIQEVCIWVRNYLNETRYKAAYE